MSANSASFVRDREARVATLLLAGLAFCSCC